MKKFLSNCKGAVTVMVTLLLIPAILVTGTGVDLARLYAAKSTLQDANQLAANAVLAEYDALLQDLYGLFGVMKSDNDFAAMVDEYLQAAVLGEDWFNREMGTFQLFYGSEVSSSGVTPAEGKNLDNPDVLRRQIEEYAKLRAPVIVVEEILDKLDTFKKTQEDAKAIQKKIKVDDGVEKVDKAYRKVYKCIQDLMPCETLENTAMARINEILDAIHGEFREMNTLREKYRQALEDAAAAEADEDYALAESLREDAERYAKEYQGQFHNVRAYLSGGNIHGYSQGEVVSSHAERGLESYVEEDVKKLKDYIDGWGNDLTTLIELCKDADQKKKDLKEKIEELESDLNQGNCTDGFREGMMVDTDESGKTIMDHYKDLLTYDLEPMAQAMYDYDSAQIQETITLMENAGLINGSTPYTWKTLQSMTINDFPINSSGGPLSTIANGRRAIHKPARDGFAQFYDNLFRETKNPEFYHNVLVPMCENKGTDQNKKTAKSNVTKIFEKGQALFKAGLVFTVEGASELPGAEDASSDANGTTFGSEGDWSKEDEGKNKLEDSLDGDFLSKLANAAGELGNQAILMVYATEMFSDYSAPRLKEGTEAGNTVVPRKTMAGIPMGPRVNYYYHSELEYLYNGNLSDAMDNLKSVAGMILLVRFVFNYVASFSVSSVRNTVSTIRTSLAGTGPFAILVSELARMGFAIGESAMDVERLRQGEKVLLYKSADKDWKFSIRGFADSITTSISEINLDDTGSSGTEGDEHGLSYTDYLRLFLLLVNGDLLATRIANLIELNMTNYLGECNADVDRMANEERFDLSQAITDFSLKTTAKLDMLFLSMPFAQEGINGVIPPKELSYSVTDYRGY